MANPDITLPRFGDIITIRENDGSTTRWRLTLENGEPKLVAHPDLPDVPGIYAPHFRGNGGSVRWLLDAHNQWHVLDMSDGSTRPTANLDRIRELVAADRFVLVHPYA